MDQVEVEITGMAITARYGTLKTGDILRTDAAFAKHLVEDCGAARYPVAKVTEPVVATLESAPAPAPAPRASKKKDKLAPESALEVVGDGQTGAPLPLPPLLLPLSPPVQTSALVAGGGIDPEATGDPAPQALAQPDPDQQAQGA